MLRVMAAGNMTGIGGRMEGRVGGRGVRNRGRSERGKERRDGMVEVSAG